MKKTFWLLFQLIWDTTMVSICGSLAYKMFIVGWTEAAFFAGSFGAINLVALGTRWGTGKYLKEFERKEEK